MTKELNKPKMFKDHKIRIAIILSVVLIVAIGLFLFLGPQGRAPIKGQGIYYCNSQNNSQDFNVFVFQQQQEPEQLISLPMELVNPQKHRVPKHIYISHNGANLIYFKKTEEIPVETVSEEQGLVAVRLMYKPVYVNLKNKSEKEIDQKIDSGSLVFSPNDTRIAWIKRVEEATVKELEATNRKRELWTSDLKGEKAKKIASLDDRVVILQAWNNNYIYFWTLKTLSSYGLGRVNIKNGEIDYIVPKYCSKDLANCQNFQFSPSGEMFIYEAGVKIDDQDEEKISLFIEDLNQEESFQIMVSTYISDSLWAPNQESIIYTEQVPQKSGKIEEKIHLVNLASKEDQEIYSGNYISQITPSKDGDYLYFIEKESDEKFNLIKLNIESGESKTIASDEYNHLKIISSW